ncbi:MAG: ABC transporter ATP-binding protein, partial [bacterium]|nr:ABC transporter ATP-binding protein [bacterium]
NEVIRLENISKKFKISTEQGKYTTLKDEFLRFFWRKKAPNYHWFWALDNINLSVPQGATVGIIGKNGSGKSTLLRIIAHILKPDTGSVRTKGRLSALIDLGAGFHPEFSGRENIYINGIILGLTKKEIDQRFDAIVEFSELQEFIDNPVKTYSAGMYTRLGFSVAVNVDPEILLVDEVFAVGDASFVQKCYAKLEEFKRRGKTIILVTHSLEAVERWCDIAFWFHNGNLLEQGTPSRIVDAYQAHIAKTDESRLFAEHQIRATEVQMQPVPANAVSPRKLSGLTTSATEPTAPQRWGDRKVEIVAVKLFDKDKKERYLFDSGESVTIELEYKVNTAVDQPVFGIGIFREDGVRCYGTNTHIENYQIGHLTTDGTIRCELDSLTLVAGNYYLDVAVHSPDEYAYDYIVHILSFVVRSELNDIGIFRPKHQWQFPSELLINDKRT